jgi:hypothetical protein
MKPEYEKEIEAKLGKEVKALGCKYIKLQVRDYPDRLILTKCGTAIFVEVKRPGEKPRRGQLKCIESLRGLGFFVFICDSVEAIDEVTRTVNRVLDYVDKTEGYRCG